MSITTTQSTTQELAVKSPNVTRSILQSLAVATTTNLYLTSNTTTFLGTTYYVLSTIESNAVHSKGSTYQAYEPLVGISVTRMDSYGNEYPISSGIVAQATGTGVISSTWPCPATVLLPTDAIVIRWWNVITNEVLCLSTTSALTMTSLNATTWTVYYAVSYVNSTLITSLLWGDLAFHPTRIQGFSTSYSGITTTQSVLQSLGVQSFAHQRNIGQATCLYNPQNISQSAGLILTLPPATTGFYLGTDSNYANIPQIIPSTSSVDYQYVDFDIYASGPLLLSSIIISVESITNVSPSNVNNPSPWLGAVKFDDGSGTWQLDSTTVSFTTTGGVHTTTRIYAKSTDAGNGFKILIQGVVGLYKAEVPIFVYVIKNSSDVQDLGISITTTTTIETPSPASPKLSDYPAINKISIINNDAITGVDFYAWIYPLLSENQMTALAGADYIYPKSVTAYIEPPNSNYQISATFYDPITSLPTSMVNIAANSFSLNHPAQLKFNVKSAVGPDISAPLASSFVKITSENPIAKITTNAKEYSLPYVRNLWQTPTIAGNVDGRSWFFYESGTIGIPYIGYAVSNDNSIWSLYGIIPHPSVYDYSSFSTFWDGTYFHIAWFDGRYIYYGKTTPSSNNADLNLIGSYETVYDFGSVLTQSITPSVVGTPSGYAAIGVGNIQQTNSRPTVFLRDGPSGSWSSAQYLGTQTASSASYAWFVSALPHYSVGILDTKFVFMYTLAHFGGSYGASLFYIRQTGGSYTSPVWSAELSIIDAPMSPNSLLLDNSTTAPLVYSTVPLFSPLSDPYSSNVYFIYTQSYDGTPTSHFNFNYVNTITDTKGASVDTSIFDFSPASGTPPYYSTLTVDNIGNLYAIWYDIDITTPHAVFSLSKPYGQNWTTSPVTLYDLDLSDLYLPSANPYVITTTAKMGNSSYILSSFEANPPSPLPNTIYSLYVSTTGTTIPPVAELVVFTTPNYATGDAEMLKEGYYEGASSVPLIDNTYNLGSAQSKWKALYTNGVVSMITDNFGSGWSNWASSPEVQALESDDNIGLTINATNTADNTNRTWTWTSAGWKYVIMS